MTCAENAQSYADDYGGSAGNAYQDNVLPGEVHDVVEQALDDERVHCLGLRGGRAGVRTFNGLLRID